MTSTKSTPVNKKGRVIRLPMLPDVHLWSGPSDHRPFDRHVHLNYHVGIVFRGAQKFWHNGGKHELSGTSIATINPVEVHDGQSVHPEGYKHGVLQFSESTLREVIIGGSSEYFKSSIMEDTELYGRHRNIFKILSKQKAKSKKQNNIT